MAIKTTLEQVEEVQAAITTVMANQSYRIGDITYTRANLSDLQKREEYLLSKYYRETGGTMANRVNFEDGL